MFLSRGDRDLGVAFQTHPGRQAFISSGSKEARSALESRRVSRGAHWVDSRESSLLGRQGSRVSMRVARGSASLLPSHGRGIWPRDVLKKVSRGLSRVEAGNPGFPRLVQVTSG